MGRRPKVTAGSLWPVRTPSASLSAGQAGPCQATVPRPLGWEDRRSAWGEHRRTGSKLWGAH